MAEAVVKLKLTADNGEMLGTLNVSSGAVDRYGQTVERNMRRAEAAAATLGNRVEGISHLLHFEFLREAGSVVFDFAKEVFGLGDELYKLSQKVGVPVETLSVLRHEARGADVDVEGLKIGLVKLAQAAADAARGSREPAAAFKAIGVSVRDAKGELKPTAALIEEVAGKFASYEDSGSKAALANLLFGKSGADLIPFLNALGEKGLKKATEDAQRYGQVMSGEAAKASEEFNTNVAHAKETAEGFAIQVANQLIPSLTSYSSEAQNAAARGLEFASSADGIATAIKVVVFGVTLFKNTLEAVVNVMAFFVDTVATGFGTLTEVVSAFVDHAKRGMKDVFTLDFSDAVKSAAEARDRIANALAAGRTSVAASWNAAAHGVKDAIDDVSLSFDMFDKKSKQAAGGVEKLAGAAGKGKAPIVDLGDASEEAAKKEQALADAVSRHRQEMIAADAKAVDARKKAKEALDDYIVSLDQEATAAGMSTQQRELYIAQMKVENYLKELGIPLSSSLAAKYLEEAAASVKLQQANQAAADAQKQIADNAQRAAQAFANPWVQGLNSVAELIGSVFSGGVKSLKDFGKQMLDIAKKIVADMIATFLRLRFINPIINSALNLGGTSSALPVAGVGSGAAGAGGAGLGTIAGLGGVGLGLGLVSQGYHSGSPLMGGIGGAVAAYSGISLAASGVLGGALAGAAAGSVVPIVGTLIGFAVGAIIAAMHKAPKPPEIEVAGSAGSVQRVENIANSPFGPARINTVGTGQVASAAVATAIVDFDKLVAGFLTNDQIAAATQRLATFDVDLKKGAATIDNVLGQRWDAILSTFPQDIQSVVKGAGDLQAQVQKLADVLHFPAQIKAILDQLGEADKLGGMTQFEAQIYQTNKAFDAAVVQLQAMSASEAQLAQVETYRANALDRLNAAQQAVDQQNLINAQIGYAQFASGLAEQVRDLGRSDFVRTLTQAAQEYANNVASLKALAEAAGIAGPRVEDLAKASELYAIKAAMAVRQLEASAADSVATLYGAGQDAADALGNVADGLQRVADTAQSFREQMLLDPNLSPLNTQQQYQEALRQLRQTGDSGTGQRALELLRKLTATGADYNRGFDLVTSLVRPGADTSGAGGGAGGGSSQLSASERLSEAQKLAQEVADIAGFRGESFADVAHSLNFGLDQLGADLGLGQDQLDEYLKSLQADSYTLDDLSTVITREVDRIVAAIEKEWALTRDATAVPVGKGGDIVVVKPGKTGGADTSSTTESSPATERTMRRVEDKLDKLGDRFDRGIGVLAKISSAGATDSTVKEVVQVLRDGKRDTNQVLEKLQGSRSDR